MSKLQQIRFYIPESKCMSNLYLQFVRHMQQKAKPKNKLLSWQKFDFMWKMLIEQFFYSLLQLGCFFFPLNLLSFTSQEGKYYHGIIKRMEKNAFLKKEDEKDGKEQIKKAQMQKPMKIIARQ